VLVDVDVDVHVLVDVFGFFSPELSRYAGP
jgi:hypothetical protein